MAKQAKQAAQPDSETFGARVSRWRRALGLSQAELARRAGYTRGYVWNIEHAQRQPAAVTRERLLDALLAAQVAAADEQARYARLATLDSGR